MLTSVMQKCTSLANIVQDLSKWLLRHSLVVSCSFFCLYRGAIWSWTLSLLLNGKLFHRMGPEWLGMVLLQDTWSNWTRSWEYWNSDRDMPSSLSINLGRLLWCSVLNWVLLKEDWYTELCKSIYNYLLPGSKSVFYALITLLPTSVFCILPLYLTVCKWPLFAWSLSVSFLIYLSLCAWQDVSASCSFNLFWCLCLTISLYLTDGKLESSYLLLL